MRLTTIVTLFTLLSCSNNNHLNLEKKNEKLTYKEVSGTWIGESEKDGIVLSELIKINTNGTFTETNSIGTIHSDSLKVANKFEGRISLECIKAQKEETGEDYYIHGITFHINNNYGTRDCRYVFLEDNKISPIATYFTEDVVLNKQK